MDVSLRIGQMEYCQGWTEIKGWPLDNWRETKAWLIETLGESNMYAGPWAYRWHHFRADIYFKREQDATLFLLRWS